MQLIQEFETESETLIHQAKQGDRVRLLAGAGAIIPLAAGTISNPICLVGALLSVGAYTWQVLAESHGNNQPPRLFPSLKGYGYQFLESAWSDIPSRSALASLYREIGKAPIVHWLESLPEHEQSLRLHQLIECRASLSDAMADADSDESEQIYAERMAVIKRVLGLSGSSTATPSRPGGTPSPAPEVVATTENIALPVLNLSDLLQYPSVLVFGSQGAGKTTLTTWLLVERAKAGHTIQVLDPHREYGQWQGYNVIGDGMNYGAIDRAMLDFIGEVKRRYQARATMPNYQPQPLTVVCEEMTGWGSQCDNSPEFVRVSLSDTRKIGCHVVYISHGRTLETLGRAKGLAAVKDAALLEIELTTTTAPDGKAIPSGRARVYYPGRKDTPIDVLVPKIDVTADTARIPVSIHQETPAEPQSSKVQHPIKVEVVEHDSQVLMLTGSPISYDASRLLAWMQRRGVSQISLRDLASGRPLGKVPHNSQTLQPLISELLRENLISVDLASKEIVLNC